MDRYRADPCHPGRSLLVGSYALVAGAAIVVGDLVLGPPGDLVLGLALVAATSVGFWLHLGRDDVADLRSDDAPDHVVARRDDRRRPVLALDDGIGTAGDHDGEATGLPGLHAMVAELRRLERVVDRSSSLMVVMVDIERFRDVNALHGRGVGDIVLRATAQRFESAVAPAVGAWRHGADAFVAIVHHPGRERWSSARDLVTAVRAATGAPIAIDQLRRIEVEVSIGVAMVSSAAHDLADAAMAAGEAALERAKTHPDRYAIVARDGDWTAPFDRAALVAELHDAFGREEIVVHYQPKVRLADLSIVGAEALVRWHHPTRGLLPPSQFLWAIEAANLSTRLTRLVLRDALGFAVEWGRQPGGPDRRVSVNLSLDELRRDHVVIDILAALAETRAEPEALCIELTEQSVLADAARSAEVVSLLRAEGIGISIDDFGTGFSSLDHLRLFEVDELKIDRSFVMGLGSRAAGRADEAIVESMVALAAGLGITAIAEGVEDADALGFLESVGCRLGQGYLFGRAVPADEFPDEVALVRT